MKSFLGVAYSLRAPYAAPQLLKTRKEKERGRAAVTHRQHKSNATTARFRACGAHEKKAKSDSLEAVVGLVEVAVDARQPECEEEHHAGVGLCPVRVSWLPGERRLTPMCWRAQGKCRRKIMTPKTMGVTHGMKP